MIYREKVVSHQAGRYRFFGGEETVQSYVNSAERVYDTRGDGLHASWMRVKYQSSGGLITTTAPDINGFYWDKVPCDHIVLRDKFTHGLQPDRPPMAMLNAALLAGTNPSSPDVDIPTFVAELRELPDLVRKFGGPVVRRLADANLRYQFGLRPLISDLTKMLGFQESVAKRFKTLQNLRRNGRKSSNQTLHSSVARYNDDAMWMHSRGPIIITRVRQITTLKISGYAIWEVTTPLPSSDVELMKLARKAVFGLTVDASTAWNLMPWSWLSDWFSNCGDIIAANRNVVGAVPRLTRLMDHTRSVISWEPRSSPTVNFSGCLLEIDSIDRYNPGLPSLAAELPGLTARQFGILGSIAATRGRGSNPYLRG